MILTVIAPDKRPGMKQMIARELEPIIGDSEVIYENWRSGLKKARGDFVCLLEYDSGISRGAIINQLEPFITNPNYKKLVMVSPLVEFEDTDAGAFGRRELYCDEMHQVRVGYVSGAIIRRSSIIKSWSGKSRFDLTNLSHDLSTTFWNGGLRVMLDPSSTYYSPSVYKDLRGNRIKPAEELPTIWQRECVA